MSEEIKLEFDIVPVTEGVIAYDTLHGYDNIHLNYIVNHKELENNREEILNYITDKVLYSSEIKEKIRSECRNS